MPPPSRLHTDLVYPDPSRLTRSLAWQHSVRVWHRCWNNLVNISSLIQEIHGTNTPVEFIMSYTMVPFNGISNAFEITFHKSSTFHGECTKAYFVRDADFILRHTLRDQHMRIIRVIGNELNSYAAVLRGSGVV